MAGMNAGALDREVLIQELTDEAKPGYPTETWDTLADGVWMSKTDAKGTERFAAGQVSASYETRWGSHWRDDMDPDRYDVPKTRRLIHRGRIYRIVAVREVGRQEGLEFFTLTGARLAS